MLLCLFANWDLFTNRVLLSLTCTHGQLGVAGVWLRFLNELLGKLCQHQKKQFSFGSVSSSMLDAPENLIYYMCIHHFLLHSTCYPICPCLGYCNSCLVVVLLHLNFIIRHLVIRPNVSSLMVMLAMLLLKNFSFWMTKPFEFYNLLSSLVPSNDPT